MSDYQEPEASPSENETPDDKGSEAIEEYGSRTNDEHKELLSPATQIGRAAQTGGTPESRLEPDEKPREGWDIPDQTGTPEAWPEPTQDN